HVLLVVKSSEEPLEPFQTNSFTFRGERRERKWGRGGWEMNMYNIQGGKEGKPRSGERLTIKHESTYYLLTSMKLHLIKGVGLASYQIRYIIFSQRHLGATFHRALAPGDAHAHTHALLHCSFSLSSFLLSHCQHTTSDTSHTHALLHCSFSLSSFLLSH
ncbi:hypothetical protein GBAR_LOCUS14393, partial [Geodia barretti]